MKLNSFLQIVGFLFTAKTVFGVLYLLFGWEASINGWIMPMWLMVLAIVADGLLAGAAFSHVKSKK